MNRIQIKEAFEQSFEQTGSIKEERVPNEVFERSMRSMFENANKEQEKLKKWNTGLVKGLCVLAVCAIALWGVVLCTKEQTLYNSAEKEDGLSTPKSAESTIADESTVVTLDEEMGSADAAIYAKAVYTENEKCYFETIFRIAGCQVPDEIEVRSSKIDWKEIIVGKVYYLLLSNPTLESGKSESGDFYFLEDYFEADEADSSFFTSESSPNDAK